MPEQGSSFIVVGIVPGQHRAVVAAAAVFAERFNAELVCATVDMTRYTVAHEADGSIVASAIDPDQADDLVEEFDPELRAAIGSTLQGRPVRWSVRALAGSPAQELTKLADELSAAMIIVGTRDPGIRGSLHEFFNGSVAVQLAHRQHRPVLVIPLNPVGPDAALPWQDTP